MEGRRLVGGVFTVVCSGVFVDTCLGWGYGVSWDVAAVGRS